MVTVITCYQLLIMKCFFAGLDTKTILYKDEVFLVVRPGFIHGYWRAEIPKTEI